MPTRRTRRGFSLVELVIAILVIGILAGVGAVVGGTEIKQAHIEEASSALQILSSNFEEGANNIGMMPDLTQAEAYLSELTSVYLPCELSTPFTEITTGSGLTGVYADTVHYTDPWGQQYRMYYFMDGTQTTKVIFACAGPNAVWSADADSGYETGNYDDDIVLVISPRA